MGVGKLFRPQAGVELGAEVGEPFAGGEVEADLPLAERVGLWAG